VPFEVAIVNCPVEKPNQRSAIAKLLTKTYARYGKIDIREVWLMFLNILKYRDIALFKKSCKLPPIESNLL